MTGAACFFDFGLWQLGAPELQYPDEQRRWRKVFAGPLREGLALHGLLLPDNGEPMLLKVNATIDRLETVLDAPLRGLLLLEGTALTPQIESYARNAGIRLPDSILLSRSERLRGLPLLRSISPSGMEAKRSPAPVAPPTWEHTTPTRQRASVSA